MAPSALLRVRAIQKRRILIFSVFDRLFRHRSRMHRFVYAITAHIKPILVLCHCQKVPIPSHTNEILRQLWDWFDTMQLPRMRVSAAPVVRPTYGGVCKPRLVHKETCYVPRAPLSKTFALPSRCTRYSASISTTLCSSPSQLYAVPPRVALSTPLTSFAAPVSNSLMLITKCASCAC